MSDAVLQLPAQKPLQEGQNVSSGALPPFAGFGANDNETVSAPQQPEARMFELPAAVWRAMIACYGVFLLALLGATGGAQATFAVVIATVYVAMFFGTVRVLLSQSPPQARSVLDRQGAVLQTAFGPLARGEVYAQALIIPAAVAFLGIAIAIISAAVI
ncbi:hypothetical protein GRI62_03340 [Erythrobacter arachoides]|uniref:Uncharacterized protein n=1 Tax=Aurantiacibacter arachoides TaxID=1850444 RepID=A0A844ZZG2_9SPHN|nr:hypothetical protein [Aurantiacibacter arachoides]MXO92640.1 hypothetical protein [Aurantiacibacter arachoides]GGD55533.1 hypothetical protein GCM10011411_14470 [Aurantiacibacter arachoides]